jgi:hypothetical protein
LVEIAPPKPFELRQERHICHLPNVFLKSQTSKSQIAICLPFPIPPIKNQTTNREAINPAGASKSWRAWEANSKILKLRITHFRVPHSKPH